MSDWFSTRVAKNPHPEPVVLPQRYRDVSIKTMNPGELKTFSIKYIQGFMENAPKGIGALVVGRSGTGKTHASAAIAKAVNGVIDVQFVQSALFIAQLERNRFGANVEKTIRDICSAGFTVIDDFDLFDPTSYSANVLMEIAESRYSNLLPTLWTGNFEIKSLKQFATQIATRYKVGFSRRLIEGTEGFRLYVR